MVEHIPGDASSDVLVKDLFTSGAAALPGSGLVDNYWVGFSNGASFGSYSKAFRNNVPVPDDPAGLSPVVRANQECTDQGACEMLEYFYTSSTTLEEMPPPFLSEEYDVVGRPWYKDGKGSTKPIWGRPFPSTDVDSNPTSIVCPSVPLANTAGEFVGVVAACVNLGRLGDAMTEATKLFPAGSVAYLVEMSPGLPLMAATVPGVAYTEDAKLIPATECNDETIRKSAVAVEKAMAENTDDELDSPLGTPGDVIDGLYVQAIRFSKLGTLPIASASWAFVLALPISPSGELSLSYSYSLSY